MKIRVIPYHSSHFQSLYRVYSECGDYLKGTREEIAASIRDRYNAHDKLVAALRGLLNVMDCDSEDGWAAEQRANARAALAEIGE